jgi:hypothetical protein
MLELDVLLQWDARDWLLLFRLVLLLLLLLDDFFLGVRGGSS